MSELEDYVIEEEKLLNSLAVSIESLFSSECSSFKLSRRGLVSKFVVFGDYADLMGKLQILLEGRGIYLVLENSGKEVFVFGRSCISQAPLLGFSL